MEQLLQTKLSDTVRINTLNRLAFLYRNSDVKKAFVFAKQARDLSEKIDYTNGLAESLGYLGLLHYREGRHDLAVEAHLKSLRLYEKLNNKRFIAFRYNDLANVYVEQEFYDKARAYFNLSLAIKEEIKDEDGIVTTLKNIANLYIHQRNYPKALEISLRTLPRAEKVGNEKTIADLLSFIAECFLHVDSLEKASLYYEKAYQLRLKNNDLYTIPRLLNGIGRIEYKKGNFAKAEEIYFQAIQIAQKNNIKVAIKRTYEYLADLYEKKQDFAKAFYYEKLANAYKDSLYNQKSNDRIAVLQSIFDDEKRQAEAEREKKIKESQIHFRDVIILTSAVVAILLAVLSVMLWKNNIDKTTKNQLLLEQKQEIELQNRNITASILYAKRIQEAILPLEQDLQKAFKNAFIWYQPKDIVSGDFYWFYEIQNSQSEYNGEKIIAVADCTGHGVPGGFMSMIGNDLLDKIIIEKEIYNPAQILHELNHSLNEVLNKDITQNMDGMEIAICRINTHKRTITYAGSMINLYLFENQNLIEYQSDKFYLGGRNIEWDIDVTFHNQNIALQSLESTFYLITDGLQDQLGGEKYRKFSNKRLKKLLTNIHTLSFAEQKEHLIRTFQDWKGKYNQTDDILVVGIQV
ncbi:MAG: tetratricopeptide repeat protein [Raineya sp.]|nr:tetratricopeptide repeat protein [Raineya sp.]